MRTANFKMSKLCAFCRFWYDPTNQNIKPINLQGGIFEIDEKADCKCQLTNLTKTGLSSCRSYKCKFL